MENFNQKQEVTILQERFVVSVYDFVQGFIFFVQYLNNFVLQLIFFVQNLHGHEMPRCHINYFNQDHFVSFASPAFIIFTLQQISTTLTHGCNITNNKRFPLLCYAPVHDQSRKYRETSTVTLRTNDFVNALLQDVSSRIIRIRSYKVHNQL